MTWTPKIVTPEDAGPIDRKEWPDVARGHWSKARYAYAEAMDGRTSLMLDFLNSGKTTVTDVKRMRDDAQARRDALNRCVAELDLIIHAAERITR